MSSILKALQKVESRNPEESYILTWRLRQRRTQSLSFRIYLFKFIGQIAAAVLAAVFLAGLGWFILARNPILAQKLFPGFFPAESTSASLAKQVDVDSLAVGSPPAAATRAERLEHPHTIIEHDLLSAADVPDYPAEPLSDADFPQDAIVTAADQASLKTVPVAPPRQPEPAPAGLTVVAVPAMPKSGAPAGLKLQALAWSDDPEKRVALINDIVVKTGRYVKGYQVSYIGRDHVVVQNQHQKWKLSFEAE